MKHEPGAATDKRPAISRRAVFAGLGLAVLAPFAAQVMPDVAWADTIGHTFDLSNTATGEWIVNFDRTMSGVPFDMRFMLESKSANADGSWNVRLKFYKKVSKPFTGSGMNRVWFNAHVYLYADGGYLTELGPGYSQECPDGGSIRHDSPSANLRVPEGKSVHITSMNRSYGNGITSVGTSYFDFWLYAPVKNFRVRFFTGYEPQKLLKTETVRRGGDATAPANPSRAGYMFTGWDRSYKNIQRDTDVYAQWKPLAKVRYWADGELKYTQENQVPGSRVNVPQEAIDRCTRQGCTPGWRGWFSDSGCTKAWNGGSVPTGTLDLYSYNELTVSFAPTTDCVPTTGTFVTAPGGPRIDYPLIPSPRTVRYGRGLSLSLPNGCLRDDGDSIYVTYRPQGYFPSASGGTPSLSLNPKQDTTIFIRWVETIAEGVETTL